MHPPPGTPCPSIAVPKKWCSRQWEHRLSVVTNSQWLIRAFIYAIEGECKSLSMGPHLAGF